MNIVAKKLNNSKLILPYMRTKLINIKGLVLFLFYLNLNIFMYNLKKTHGIFWFKLYNYKHRKDKYLKKDINATEHMNEHMLRFLYLKLGREIRWEN